jgi:hypothetical protein
MAPAQGTRAGSGVRNTLSGRVVDARGEPLAGHVVRLSQPTVGTPIDTSVETTTDPDGRFTLTDARRGAKLLQLFGPGKGDVAALQPDKKAPSGVGVGFRTDEGKIYFAMPPEGLAGVVIVGPRHACFWVEGHLEPQDPGTEPWHLYFLPGDIEMCAAPPDWGADVDRRDDWSDSTGSTEHDATRIQLGGANYERQLNHSFLVGADKRSDRTLVVAVRGYATEVRTVQGELLIERLGSIKLGSVAGLTVDVYDAVTSELLDDGTIELRETGGGLPDRVSRHIVSNYIRDDLSTLGKTIWSERRSGHYELRISVPGYAEWTGSGDLVLEQHKDPPRVTAELARAR